MNGPKRANLFLIELLFNLFIFALCAAVCVGLLVHARRMSLESTRLTQAVYLAQSTAEAMRLGLLTGSAMMVGGFIDRFLAMPDMAGANIVATGGSAALVASRCSHPILFDADLTLKGLHRLYQLNTAKRV